MRVIVCGGRVYNDREAVFRALSRADAKRPISVVIHGACPTGADWLAAMWAVEAKVHAEPYPADWSVGRKAGPLRNQRMIDVGKPDGVIAFPGGSGTADMIRRAEAARITIWRPYRCMAETLVQVSAPHFCAGIVLIGDRCTEAAPILQWAIGKDRAYLLAYFGGKGWTATIVPPKD
jgi:YspA, cpYpsA-related SLOG family